ncbi:MAG TPA: hypothetical protein VME18_11345 [Acidobacteriaceae bacterium]|nr:hypothetical protein [Acidobacteriaceae bacterium]
MRLYDATVAQFKKDVAENTIADLLRTRFENYYRRFPGPSEYKSWQNSSNYLRNAFENSGLENNRLIIEYELPYSTRRLDVLVFGSDQGKTDSIVLIELKQWSNEHVFDCDVEGNVLVDYGLYKRERAHPSLQVQGYHFDLTDFMTAFSDTAPLALSSCAYCHNYSRNDARLALFSPQFETAVKAYPIFTKEDAKLLGDFLKARVFFSNGESARDRFIFSPIRPSKKLLEHTREMINRIRLAKYRVDGGAMGMRDVFSLVSLRPRLRA